MSDETRAYGLVSQSVSVGPEQSSLRPEEGPGHAVARRGRLLLQLIFQGRDLRDREGQLN